jgi:hypothetical protein
MEQTKYCLIQEDDKNMWKIKFQKETNDGVWNSKARNKYVDKYEE